jgi:two-component system NtrC family response regulator
LVERANGGTLFIDELGEMPIPMQVKLLRVLQDKKVVRVGENNARAVDFRLVAATNRNLLELAKAGRFREDLYYRVAAATIVLPPLRERGSDVVLLAKFFKERFCEKHHLPQKEFSVSALDALQNYAWPGNVRELENLISRAVVMAESLVIRAQDLGLAGESEDGIPKDTESFESAKDSWMRNYLVGALAQNNNNRANTAKALGIAERTLFRYLEQLGIKGLQQ